MIGTLVGNPAFNLAALPALESVAGWTDEASAVYLVDEDFDVNDPLTWPLPSDHFVAEDASASAQVYFDAVTSAWYLVFPDPVGGWLFTAATITTSISVTGYVVQTGGNNIGAAKIGPVTVTANGQNILLPIVALALNTPLFQNGGQPTPV